MIGCSRHGKAVIAPDFETPKSANGICEKEHSELKVLRQKRVCSDRHMQ